MLHSGCAAADGRLRVIHMPNPKNKRTISLLVPADYPFGGAEVKRELEAFFQHVVDSAPEAVATYPKLDKIVEVLEKW